MKRQAAFVSTPTWDPGPSARARVDHLIERYRKSVTTHLAPLVRTYNPAMLTDAQDEYRKMLELSAKMNVVGHACTEIFGHDYDERRQSIGSLFGACCFLADSFIDDFGERVTREYLERLEVLLTDGWFDLRTDRERLFFVILSRLFVERDLLHPTVRQAILQLYDALAARRAFRDNGPMSLPELFDELSPAPWSFAEHIYGLHHCLVDRDGRVIASHFPISNGPLLEPAPAMAQIPASSSLACQQSIYADALRKASSGSISGQLESLVRTTSRVVGTQKQTFAATRRRTQCLDASY